MAIPGLNSKVLDKVIKTLGLQSAVERLPVDLVPTIQPVMEVTPVPIIDTVKNVETAGTMFTTPTGRDFFLTRAALSYSNGSSAQSGRNAITVVLESGETVEIITLGIANSVDKDSWSDSHADFSIPIKLKRGSDIIATETTTTTKVEFNIQGYTQDII